MTEIYRIRRVVGTDSSSSGDAKIYEGREAFERDLLYYAIEVYGMNVERNRDPLSDRIWRACKRWLDMLWGVKGEKQPGRFTKKILAVQQLVDGEWVDLPWELVAPHIAWGER